MAQGPSRAKSFAIDTVSRPFSPHRLIDDVEFGEDVVVHAFTNLYGCRIGARTRIGTFVEVQRGAEIGAACKIQSHTFICDGVTIEDEVFVGHGVIFVNDKLPAGDRRSGALQTEADWELLRTVVERGATIGSGCDDPRRGHDRRRRDGRRRRRRRWRRARRSDGRRQPGGAAAGRTAQPLPRAGSAGSPTAPPAPQPRRGSSGVPPAPCRRS